jgi:protoheme IX farnesyltransferase
MKTISGSNMQNSAYLSDNDGLSAAAAWKPYYQMMKPTISLLVVITVIPSLIMASEGLPPLMVAVWTVLGTFLASGSAGMFNHLVDSDVDQTMERTQTRPIPTGQVSRPLAATMATVLGVISFIMLYWGATPLAAWVAIAANAFYVLVYTMYLKRRTVQNIVIGGAAGAVGPLIGWAAVTNELSWVAWALFLVIFLWTPPHFWALAIKYREDYAKAKIPMLPAIHGVAATRNQILIYTLTLLPVIASLVLGNAAGWIYGLVSGGLTLYFIWLAYRLWKSRQDEKAMPLFLYSCVYLFGVFGALTIDRLLHFH